MANIAAYSRHKMLDELNSPLFTTLGTGATASVLTPAEQKATALANLTDGLSDAQLLVALGGLQQAAALPTGAAVTTGATTALHSHYSLSPISGIIRLTLTNFALGNSGDNASLAGGASLITFPTETFVRGVYLSGTMTLADDDMAGTAAEMGLGTTIGSGAVSVLGGTPAFESVLGGTATAAGVDGGTTTTFAVLAPVLSVNAAGGHGSVLRTTTPGLAVFLNWSAAWVDMAAAAALTFSGTVGLEYIKMA